MLIEKYDLEVFTPPCEPGAERFSAAAHLETDISEVLPYLNATLTGTVYNKVAHALTGKKSGHKFAFQAHEVSISDVEDRTEAVQELESLIALANDTWDRRDEIEPDYEMHQRPTPMALYKLLPGTNCRQCGLPTCWNFALKLASSKMGLDACPPLQEPTYAEQLAQLKKMVLPVSAGE